jgi:hypothetical protein
MNLLMGMLVMGLLTILVGSIVQCAINAVNPHVIPEACKDWNKDHIMEKNLFLTGSVLYLIGYQISNRQPDVYVIMDGFRNKIDSLRR